MDTLRITIKVETWAGPSATKAEETRAAEGMCAWPMPEGYAESVADLAAVGIRSLMRRAGLDVREVPPDTTENPPP